MMYNVFRMKAGLFFALLVHTDADMTHDLRLFESFQTNFNSFASLQQNYSIINLDN